MPEKQRSAIRFHDKGTYDAEFQHEIAVRCPRCQRRAYVLGDGNRWRAKRAKLSCSSCGYNASWNPENYKGPATGVAKRRCRYCGRWLERRCFGTPHKHEARLLCPGCKTETLQPIAWSRTQQSTPSDPYFGHPLWFVSTVKGDVFWAYNAAHLSFIRNYVQATIRIREPNRNSSLASRLPQFLLDHRNRLAVLKAIRALENS